MSQNSNQENNNGLDKYNKEIKFSDDSNKEVEENTVDNQVTDDTAPATEEQDVQEQETQQDVQEQDVQEQQENEQIYDEKLDYEIPDISIEQILKEKSESEASNEDEKQNTEDIEEIVQTQTVPSQEVLSEEEKLQEPKFVVDIADDVYNVSDFEHEEYQDEYDEDIDDEDEEETGKKRKKKTSVLGMFFRIILAFMLIAVLAFAAIAGVYAYGDISGITGNGINVKVTIPPDTYVSEVGDILKENGVIKYPQIFRAYIKYIYKKDVTLHYGKFNLNSSMSYEQLLQTLQNPAESESGIKFTIIEGETIYDIAKSLEESHICTSQEFLDAVANGQYDFPFVNEIPNPQERMFRLEGYLFPDTYTFKQDTPADEVIKTLLSNFESKFTGQMEYAISISEYSFDEIITLASIIQAEASTKADMMKVSSVYRNRLANPTEYPKLQADPTSKYANRVLLPAGASEELANKYDTYKTEGLPLGPINNPGLDAILAAIYPATTDYYYFCSDLISKQFYYADTYEKHKENLSLAGLSEEEATE